MHAIAQAKTKLILFGEHAAIYGYPALAVSLPWGISVGLENTQDDSWHFPKTLSDEDVARLRKSVEILNRILPEISSHKALRMTVQSQVPIGIGFGSSAAFSVALIRATLAFTASKTTSTEDITSDRIWSLAHELEGVFHGHPSGIDTGISAHEGLCYFRGKKEGLPERIPVGGAPLHLVVGALPRSGHTAGLIGQIRKKVESDDMKIKEDLLLLGELADKAKAAIENQKDGASETIGQLAGRAQKYLADLDLSTALLDNILSAGMNFGALGGKLSGAGGGGAYYLVAENHEAASDIAEKLKKYISEKDIEIATFPSVIMCGADSKKQAGV